MTVSGYYTKGRFWDWGFRPPSSLLSALASPSRPMVSTSGLEGGGSILGLGSSDCVTENGVSSNFPTLDGFVGVEDLIPSSLQLLDKGGTQPVGTALVTDESNMFVVLDEAGIREVENGTTANGTAVELVTLPDDLFDEPKHGGADLIAEIAVDFSLAPPQISTSPLGPSQTGNVKSGGKGLSSKGGGGRKSRR